MVLLQPTLHPDFDSDLDHDVQLGAAVEDDVSAATTHVVAGMDGTDKVHWGRRHGKHVVTPAWLQHSGAPHGAERSVRTCAACHIPSALRHAPGMAVLP